MWKMTFYSGCFYSGSTRKKGTYYLGPCGLPLWTMKALRLRATLLNAFEDCGATRASAKGHYGAWIARLAADLLERTGRKVSHVVLPVSQKTISLYKWPGKSITSAYYIVIKLKEPFTRYVSKYILQVSKSIYKYQLPKAPCVHVYCPMHLPANQGS